MHQHVHVRSVRKLEDEVIARQMVGADNVDADWAPRASLPDRDKDRDKATRNVCGSVLRCLSWSWTAWVVDVVGERPRGIIQCQLCQVVPWEERA